METERFVETDLTCASAGRERRAGTRRERFANRAAVAVIWAAAQFLVLTAIAMLLYPGGNDQDTAAPGYSFTLNFFSDLGATRAYSHQASAAANGLFIYSLVFVGITLAAFGLAAREIRGEAGKGRVAAALAAAAAIISGLAFIGIAATPWNLAPAAHLDFVQAAFGFLLLFNLCLTALEIRARWNRRLIAANVVYAVLLAAYVWLLFWGPTIETRHGLITQVVAQKAIVYASILNLGWQAIGFRRARRSAGRVVDSAG
jgi:hypothetical membrane protein